MSFDALSKRFESEIQYNFNKELTDVENAPLDAAIAGLRSLMGTNTNVQFDTLPLLKMRIEALRDYQEDPDTYIPEKLSNGDALSSEQIGKLKTIYQDTFNSCVNKKLQQLQQLQAQRSGLQRPAAEAGESSTAAHKRAASPSGVERPAQKQHTEAAPADAFAARRLTHQQLEARRLAQTETDIERFGMDEEVVPRIVLDCAVDAPDFIKTLLQLGVLKELADENPAIEAGLMTLARTLGEYKLAALRSYAGEVYAVSAVNFIENPQHVEHLREWYNAKKDADDPDFDFITIIWEQLKEDVKSQLIREKDIGVNDVDSLRGHLTAIYTNYEGNAPQLPDGFNPPPNPEHDV